MAITPLKMVKMTWLCQSGQFLGWFWGGLLSSLFLLGIVFFQKIAFLNFYDFKNLNLTFSEVHKKFTGGRKVLKSFLNSTQDQYTKSQNAKKKFRKQNFRVLSDELSAGTLCPPPLEIGLKKK